MSTLLSRLLGVTGVCGVRPFEVPFPQTLQNVFFSALIQPQFGGFSAENVQTDRLPSDNALTKN